MMHLRGFDRERLKAAALSFSVIQPMINPVTDTPPHPGPEPSAIGRTRRPAASSSPAETMGYLAWHRKPGYWRDVTRHFDAADEILDIGCGSAWLAEHFERYTGLDASPEAVESARERGYRVYLSDLTSGELPFEDDAFDGVVLKDVLEHLPPTSNVVREVRRVLRPGGVVFVSSPDAQRWVWHDYTHFRPYTRRALRRLFADAGFSIHKVGYESVMPGTSIVSGWTRTKRRPLPLRAAAWLPITRRNVWLVAHRQA
jgi:SAM-dependent methyltransferase